MVEEFQYIAETFPFVKEIFIEDDTFTVDRSRCRQICQLLTEAKNKISWTANARADVDFETLKMMKAAGCRLLCVGVESGNQNILNNIKKGLALKRIRKFFKDAKKAGKEIRKEWARQKAYHLIGEMARSGDMKYRAEIKKLSDDYDLEIPYADQI